jgi:putative thioredoxin
LEEQEKPGVTALRSRLFFEGQLAGAPDTAELEESLTADPGDHEARYRLALRNAMEQDYETAMALLLELMQQDRRFGDDAGRRALVKIFELLGDDPRVSRYRRRMASLLH